jgi:hypothetical protein
MFTFLLDQNNVLPLCQCLIPHAFRSSFAPVMVRGPVNFVCGRGYSRAGSSTAYIASRLGPKTHLTLSIWLYYTALFSDKQQGIFFTIFAVVAHTFPTILQALQIVEDNQNTAKLLCSSELFETYSSSVQIAVKERQHEI